MQVVGGATSGSAEKFVWGSMVKIREQKTVVTSYLLLAWAKWNFLVQIAD
jgi:hypothetical protein